MSASLINALLDGPFALTPRPEPVPGDLRVAWGIALVVLILGKSRGKRASLQKLHFLAHSARTRQARLEAQEVFARERRPSDFVVRVEPWLNRALAFARGAGLIDLEKGKSANRLRVASKCVRRCISIPRCVRRKRHFLKKSARRQRKQPLKRSCVWSYRYDAPITTSRLRAETRRRDIWYRPSIYPGIECHLGGQYQGKIHLPSGHSLMRSVSNGCSVREREVPPTS